MSVIFYGTKTTTKFIGYFGSNELCKNCNHTYSKSLVKYKNWFHLYYVPLIPYKTYYVNMCPICGFGKDIDNKDAKSIMTNKNETQNLQLIIKRDLNRKPKNLLDIDKSYEVYVLDKNKNEEICISKETTYEEVKNIKKNMGIKKVNILNINK